MQENSGTERLENSSARWRWGRAILCLLFTFGIFFHLGHPMPAHAHLGVAQLVHADSGVDPCEQPHALGVDHCKSANPCPFCGPVGLDATVFDDTGSRPSVIANALVHGLVTDPQLRPPRLLLQV